MSGWYGDASCLKNTLYHHRFCGSLEKGQCWGQDLLLCAFLYALSWWCQDYLSLIFKLFPEEELILGADKGDRMGAGSQSPNPASFCMATHSYLLNIEYLWIFIRITHWKVKEFRKSLLLLNTFICKMRKWRCQGNNWLTLRHICRVRTWAKIQLFNSYFSFFMSKPFSTILMANELFS